MKQENEAHSNSATGELTTPRLTPVYTAKYPSALVRVDLAGQTHVGYVRSNNEDHFLTARVKRSLELLMTNLPGGTLPASFDEIAYAMAVADGMGGMAAGETASSMALLKLIEFVVNTSDWVMRFDEHKDSATVMQRMTHRFRRIDEALTEEGLKEPALFGMGTTLTIALSLGADILVGHLGDSRAYLLRNHKLHQLTRDHTVGQALVDSGITRPEDSTTRAMRHVLTAALGANTDHMDAQVQRFHLNDSDQVLICTDGLTQMVTDTEIATTLLSSSSATEGCGSLIDLALRAGGTDNVSVAVARYQFPPRPDS